MVVALAIGLPRWWSEINAVSPFALFLIGYGAYLGFLVVQGLIRGSIRLQLRGFSAVYDRVRDPHRYWGSVVANTALTCVFMGIAILQFRLPTPAQTAADKRDNDICYAQTTASNGAAAVAACSRLLANDRDPTERPYDLNARAAAYAALGDTAHATSDTAEGLRELDRLLPDHADDKDLLALHEQLLQRRWEAVAAIRFLDDAIARDPRNPKLRVDRSNVWAKYQNYQNAIADLDEAHRLDPGDAAVLASRGLYHAWLNQADAARRDLDEAERRAPGNPIALHGEAVLAGVEGLRDRQLAWLGRALAADPTDDWALEQRARVFEASDDVDRARADWDRLRAIRERQGRPLTGT